MTLTLILIRHAKSDWGDAALPDHDRPLNDRGRRAAPRIGAWLAAHGLLPETVLCSTALRTRETWAGISSALPGAPAPELSRALYHAAPQDMLQAIWGARGNCTALVAHNPGIASLAWSLCARPPAHPKFGVYPTGATLVLSFEVAGWSEVGPGAGRVVDFVVPRELPDPA